MGVKVADKFVAMGDFELLNAQDILVDIKGTPKRLQEAIDNGELDNSEIILDSSTNTTTTWSSSKIESYVTEKAAPTYSGTVMPTKISSGATITTDWDISGGGNNADYGRLLMLSGPAGTFLIHIKGNIGNTTLVPTPTVVSSIGNSLGASWSTDFEFSVSGGKLRIKNKSGSAASWRFI